MIGLGSRTGETKVIENHKGGNETNHQTADH